MLPRALLKILMNKAIAMLPSPTAEATVSPSQPRIATRKNTERSIPAGEDHGRATNSGLHHVVAGQDISRIITSDARGRPPGSA